MPRIGWGTRFVPDVSSPPSALETGSSLGTQLVSYEALASIFTAQFAATHLQIHSRCVYLSLPIFVVSSIDQARRTAKKRSHWFQGLVAEGGRKKCDPLLHQVHALKFFPVPHVCSPRSMRLHACTLSAVRGSIAPSVGSEVSENVNLIDPQSFFLSQGI